MNINISPDIQKLIIFLAVGLFAGWAAGRLMKGSGFGIVGNLIVGVVGALIGGFLFKLIGFSYHGLLGEVVISVVGAIVFVILIGFIKR